MKAIILTILMTVTIPVIRDYKKIEYNAIEEMYSRLTGLAIHGTRSTTTYEEVKK